MREKGVRWLWGRVWHCVFIIIRPRLSFAPGVFDGECMVLGTVLGTNSFRILVRCTDSGPK